MDVAIEYGKEHVGLPYFQHFVEGRHSRTGLTVGLQGKDLDDKVDACLDRLLVEFGKDILKIVPGRVSTEVDARFSFDTHASVQKALHMINVRTATRVLDNI